MKRKEIEPMNADEIVKRLREYASRCDGTHSCWHAPTLNVAADLIESLTAENAKLKIRDKTAKYHVYKDKWADAQIKLAASQRRERAAVESWRGFCAKCDWRGRMWLSDGQPDGRCKTCRDNNKCNWQWRGPAAGEGERDERAETML